jgi:small subunit ribosomal protein S1
MSENFADLFRESLEEKKLYPGAVLSGTVINIDGEYVIVDAGLKSESAIHISQFQKAGEVEVNIGDAVSVVLDSSTMEDGNGVTRLSREKAKKFEIWGTLLQAFENNETVEGIITGKVKGGFTVEIENIRAFLPGSLVDGRSGKDVTVVEGKPLDFKIIKIDQKRNNVVVSRRLSSEAENNVEREALLESLQEGSEVRGTIKNLTEYGAFVDLGGIDGLLHITDMAWRRVKHPSEIVTVGQELNVKILKFDKEKNRVSLGLKQLASDPWVDLKNRYPANTKLKGRVTSITDYGCFVEIEDGVEGLVHVSEMDWTNKSANPHKIVQLDTMVEVMLLDIDEERRRVSLGLKQCQTNPWLDFAAKHQKGDKVVGIIKYITDFGMFLGLEGEIDGLIHLSDISWSDAGEEVIRQYKKGQELTAVILGIDAERERISLGIKQLDNDLFAQYLADHPKGSLVQGKVISVDEKIAIINLAPEVNGTLKNTEFNQDRVDDLRLHLSVDTVVEAKITGIDRKNCTLILSIRAKDLHDGKEILRELSKNSEEMSSTTLGDIFKDKFNEKE